jgi:hypothetical protein
MRSRIIGWVGRVTHIGKWSGACRDLVRKPEGNRPLGGRRCKWEDNFEMVGQEIGWGTWNGLIWARRERERERLVACCCEHGNEPLGYIKCGEIF